jgi:hypothetical protein
MQDFEMLSLIVNIITIVNAESKELVVIAVQEKVRAQ